MENKQIKDLPRGIMMFIIIGTMLSSLFVFGGENKDSYLEGYWIKLKNKFSVRN